MKNKYYRHFNFFDIDKEENFDKSRLTLLKNFKVQQQTKINTCGSCCALAVLNYYGDFRFSEMQLAKIMKTLALWNRTVRFYCRLKKCYR